MALSDVGLCARALIKIGAAPITSFVDTTAEAEIAGALYPQVRDALLSAYPWSFASGQVALARLNTPPLADFAYAYGLPNDFLRAVSAGHGARGRGLRFRIAAGALHTDAQAVVLSYVFRPEEAAFPPYFDQLLILKLASEFCIPVTESTSRAESLYDMAEREFQKVRQIDAQQDTPNKIEDFSLITARE